MSLTISLLTIWRYTINIIKVVAKGQNKKAGL